MGNDTLGGDVGMKKLLAIIAVIASVFVLVSCISLLLGAECICRCLVSLWFAFGAVAAFVLAVLGRQIEEQLLMFVLASLAAFLLIRPLAFLGNFLKNLKQGIFL